MSTPIPPPLTTTSVTQVTAGKTIPLVLSNIDPFSMWSLWITISAGTDSQFPKNPATWGAQLVDNNSKQVLLRCQLHISGPNASIAESASLWLGGLVLADHNSPFSLSFKTDANVPHMYVRANGGVYYSVV